MDEKVYHLIVQRIDRLEGKVDILLEFKWKIAGLAIAVGILSATVFEIFVLVMQHKGG